MPNGYTDTTPVFNKVLKPQFAYLREHGMSSVVYVDDTLLGGNTFDNVFRIMFPVPLHP